MHKDTDFRLDSKEFAFKRDSYPLSKINDARVKELTLLDNLGQIIFWMFIFSGAVWLAIPDFETAPLWLKILAISLSVSGFLLALLRCSRYALQIEFRHIDETGNQWVNVAKSYSKSDFKLYEKQVLELKRSN